MVLKDEYGNTYDTDWRGHIRVDDPTFTLYQIILEAEIKKYRSIYYINKPNLNQNN